MVQRRKQMAKEFSFPVFKTKIEGLSQPFALEDPVERRKYFELKAGKEIEKIREYLERGNFLAILLGPKNSGKGTYSKLFAEAIGGDRIRHISVGDIVRDVHAGFKDKKEEEKLAAFLRTRYRGALPLNQAIDALLGRSTSSLLPTELILALIEYEISKDEKKAIFVDGFPRSMDQISYSIYFRELMGYQDNPDFFVFIDVPETIIGERMKYRVVCPRCHAPRNLKLLRTKEIGYDKEKDEFYLMCDDPQCGHARMSVKEGDDLGIEAIRERIEADKAVMQTLLKMEGVPKVYLRNAIPVAEAAQAVDAYELTPSYEYTYDAREGKVRVKEIPWVVPDEDGVPSYSLLPATVVTGLIKQVPGALGI